MRNTKNKVDIINNNDAINLTVQIAQPKWLINGLFIISAMLIVLLIISIYTFDLIQLFGLKICILIAFVFYVSYRIFNTAVWYQYAEESYTIKDSSFDYQTRYSFSNADHQTVTDKTYQIRLSETSSKAIPDIARKGLLIFYNIHPITQKEIIIFQSVLEISLREFEIIHHNLSTLRNKDNLDIKNLFSD